MTQFRNLRVSGEDVGGTYTLYSTWTVSVGAVTSGPFTYNAACSWPGGSGRVWKEENGLLYFDRRSGDLPEVGDVVTDGTASATIVAIEDKDLEGLDQNPPLFLTSPGQGPVSVSDTVHVDTGTQANQTIKVLSIPEEDQLVVDKDPTGIEFSRCWITRDFTPNNRLPIPSSGDARVANQLAEAFEILDNLSVFGDWKDVASDSVSGYSTDFSDVVAAPISWRAEPGAVQMAGAAQWNGASAPAVNQLLFQLPAGDRPRSLVRFATTDGVTIQIDVTGFVRVLDPGSDPSPIIFFDVLRFPTP